MLVLLDHPRISFHACPNSTVYAGFLDTIQPMDCGERDGLKVMYVEAVKGDVRGSREGMD